MVKTQSDVGVLFDSRSEAIWMKDIERLMSLYSPDIVYFDLVPLSGTWDRLRCDGGSWTGLRASRARSARKSAT